jgi:hypothetical protein
VLPRHGTRFLLVRLAAVAARMPCAGDIDMAVTVHGDMGMCRLATAVCRVAWRGPRGVSAWHVCRYVLPADARCAPAAPPLIGPRAPPRPHLTVAAPRGHVRQKALETRGRLLKGKRPIWKNPKPNRQPARRRSSEHRTVRFAYASPGGRPPRHVYAATVGVVYLLTYSRSEAADPASTWL